MKLVPDYNLPSFCLSSFYSPSERLIKLTGNYSWNIYHIVGTSYERKSDLCKKRC